MTASDDGLVFTESLPDQSELVLALEMDAFGGDEESFCTPYPLEEMNEPAWMVQDLAPHEDAVEGGVVGCARALMKPNHGASEMV